MSALGSGVLGAGTLAGGEESGGVTQQGVANFSATATQTASSTRSVFAVSSLSASSTISATAFNTDPGATFAATAATFTSTAFQTHAGGANYSADATANFTGYRIVFGDSSYIASAIIAETSTTKIGYVDLTADATFAAAPLGGAVQRALHIATDGLLTGIQSLGAAVRGYLGGLAGSTTRQASASMLGRAFIQAFVPPDRKGAGHKHLWTPLREAVTEPVSLKQETRLRFKTPQTPVPLSIGVDTDPVRVRHLTKVKGIKPLPSVVPPEVSVRAPIKVKTRKPRGAVNTGFVRVPNEIRVNWLPPIPEVVVMPVPVRGKTYHAYWTPETVQNPTEELLMML